LGLLVVCVALGLLSGLSPAQLGWQLAPLAPQVLLGVAAGTGLALLFHGATRWLIAATGYRYYSASVLEYVVPRMPREFAAVAGVMVLIVLLEELLFRSLLVGGLLPLVPWPLLLAATGIAFGVMHSPQGLWGMAGAGLAGAGLGALFLWSGSLVLPTVTHYIANLLQIWLVMRRPPPQVSD
jgi:membrane protease YdiL (CAAX protease family)